MAYHIQEIFVKASGLHASDVHLVADLPPLARIDGELIPVYEDPLTPELTKKLAYGMLDDRQKSEFERERELDFSHFIPDAGRFRINLHWERGRVGLTARIISPHIPTMEELDMPPVSYDLARLHEGLILVTGPAGSGKSTTLAAMINLINNERNAHVITMEDPIEFVYKHNKSVIKQRELGSDIITFASGLKRVLRQDPNVILIGEMRDLETTAATLTLAETGHLVVTTLHTYDAAQTVDRIIDIFPPFQQHQVRLQLSISLRGILTQKLLPRVDKGRVAAREILINTPAISNLIRTNKISQIHSAIQTGGKEGMQLMEKSIAELYRGGIISKEVADSYLYDQNF
jgi:twitching motility protein PilT